MFQHAAAEDADSEVLAGREVGSCDGEPVAVQTQRSAHVLALGQALRPFLVVPLEGGLQPLVGRCDSEGAAPHVFGLDGDVLHAVADGARDVDGFAVLVGDLESHAVLHTLYKMSALGIECHLQVGLLHAGQAGFRPLVHAAGVVVASLFGLAVDGEHAAVEAVPHAVVVGGHLLVVEPPGLVLAVAMVAHVEVQHPAGVGPQLVVAAVEGVGQDELSAAEVALRTDDDGLPLYEHAVGREQLDVEQAAHVGGLQVVGPDDVCLVPQRVTHKVALVVGVHINLLLHLRNGRLLQSLPYVVDVVGTGGQGQGREQEGCELE